MSKYDNPCFDDCRKWIQKKRERGASWQNLQLACKDSEEELNAFLSSRAVEDDWPDLSVDEWKQRWTRGYKRYKETSGLIEWKECQIFHSIFT